MHNTDAPPVLWEGALYYESQVKSFIESYIYQLQGRKPYKYLTGQTPDITGFVQFCWHGSVYNWIQNSFTDGKNFLGCFLGIAHNVVSAMCYYILPSQPKTRETNLLYPSTVCNLTEEERRYPKFKAVMEALDPSIKSCLVTAAIGEKY